MLRMSPPLVMVDSIEARTAWYSERGILSGGVDIFTPIQTLLGSPT
jgi:hypothetical protein